MNKKDAKALVQAMREDGHEAHVCVHGITSKRRTFSVLLVPHGTFYRAADYVKWKEKQELKKKEATGHE